MHLIIIITTLFAVNSLNLAVPVTGLVKPDVLESTDLEPRTYAGLCSRHDCGATHVNRGSCLLCVGYTDVSSAYRLECTCSGACTDGGVI
jgi:hypothetical protein